MQTSLTRASRTASGLLVPLALAAAPAGAGGDSPIQRLRLRLQHALHEARGVCGVGLHGRLGVNQCADLLPAQRGRVLGRGTQAYAAAALAPAMETDGR